jgi:hypothetical protein
MQPEILAIIRRSAPCSPQQAALGFFNLTSIEMIIAVLSWSPAWFASIRVFRIQLSVSPAITRQRGTAGRSPLMETP